MRKNIVIYLNGSREEISAENSFMTTAEFLRYKKGLTGTKVVCSEGDCGACTILVSRFVNGKLGPYKSLNSCISFLYLLDRCHLITVEGVGEISHMHPVQESMLKCHGAQCGYCTPGIVCALAQMGNDLKNSGKIQTEKKVKNYLSGNLCRCTGYEPIIQAGMDIELDKVETFESIYDDKEIEKNLALLDAEVSISTDKKSVYLPKDFSNALEFKENNKDLIITSGATDLGVVENKGKINIQKSMTLNNIDSAYKVDDTKDFISIGAKVSLTEVENACERDFLEFSKKLHIFASPQIKNTATLVGNIINASPISDTVPFLRVAQAKLKLSSKSSSREVDINDFIKEGYKQLDLKQDEVVESVIIPKTQQKFKLYKVSIRKDLDISTVTFACRYKLNGDVLEDFSLAFGGVGAYVLRATDIETKAKGMKFTQENFKKLSLEVRNIITPMSDHRGSAEYRYQLCENLLLKFCDEVLSETRGSIVEASI